MLRTLVTLLVSLQLLMPPGMCVCQFAPSGKASAASLHRSAPQNVSTHISVPRSECRCDSCREDAASSDRNRPTPTDDAPAHPAPGKHAPGCPAALGDMPTKMVTPAVELNLDAGHAASYVFSLSERLAPVSLSRDRTSFTAPAPPLFISHCTLLI